MVKIDFNAYKFYRINDIASVNYYSNCSEVNENQQKL